MPTQIEPKAVDPEAELSSALRRFTNLSAECSIAKRAGGVPQLAPQEKQIGILKSETKETQLCINLARKGQHAVRDANVKKGIKNSITEYEQNESILRDERAQSNELDLLNYLAGKRVAKFSIMVPTENDEIACLEDAYNRLRRMENRLDLTTKKFCIVNSDNKAIRDEIHRLLVERNSFNIQWNQTINKLMKGKEYLMDILEIAGKTFSSRDDTIRILETLKWKGLYQLNKDIAEMQSYDSELNHLAKLEEFLRVKGSKRICEADEKEEVKRLEEIARCEQDVAWHDSLLEEIFSFAGTDRVATIIEHFRRVEIENFAQFVLNCEVMEESIFLKRDLDILRQKIMDQHDINQARIDKQAKRIAELTEALSIQNSRSQEKLHQNVVADGKFTKLLKDIDDLSRMAKCDTTPLLNLLGNHQEVTKWNVRKFLNILETEVKSIIQVVYGAVKPPAPTPRVKGAPPPRLPDKIIADPRIQELRPNRIENLVPYQPCAYCVEDYIMNLIYETPAEPADEEFVERIFHLEDINTKFGIFTLTVAAKRHPFRGASKD